MKETELLMWLGIIIGSLLIVTGAIVLIVVAVIGGVSAIGWLYDKFIRWRVRNSRE